MHARTHAHPQTHPPTNGRLKLMASVGQRCHPRFPDCLLCYSSVACGRRDPAGATTFITEVTFIYVCGLRYDSLASFLSVCPSVCCCSQHFLFPCLEVFVQGNLSHHAVSCKAFQGIISYVSTVVMYLTQVEAAGGSLFPNASSP